ncbi:MAG: GAF domain-containing protein [Proteobacteria bacterium]|nr:GAF domain-containing protein [Pseudomonadota bacterium]
MKTLKKIKNIFFSDEELQLSEQGAMESLQTTFLYEIGKAMSSSMVDKEKTHKLITEAVIMILQVEGSILMLKDEKTGGLIAKAGSGLISEEFLSGFSVSPDEGIVGRVAESGEVCLINDAEYEEGIIKEIVDKFNITSMLVAPLKAEGKSLGVIAAYNKRSGDPFNEGDIKLLSVLAGLAATAETNAALIENLKDSASRLKALFDIGQALNSTLKLQELLDLIIDKAIEVTTASSGSIMLLSEKEDSLIIRSARGLSAEAMTSTKLKVGEGVTGWVARKGKALLVSDVSKDNRYRSVNENVKSELAVPMVLEDKLIGVINVDHYELDAFTCWDMETLSTLASSAVVAIRNAELFGKLEKCTHSLDECKKED